MNADSTMDEAAAPETSNFDFDLFFAVHYERIARVVARVVRDPGRAEEIAVEALWKLSRSPSAQGEQAAAWLYRAAIRAGLDDLRCQARRARFERLLRPLTPVTTPEQAHSATERQAQVRSVLARIKPRHAELLLLRSNDLTYERIAEVLSLNPASVGTLVSRAQQAFRKQYVKQFGELA